MGARRAERGRRFPAAVHEREANLVPHAVITPDLADEDLVVFGQSPRDVDHARRHVEVERRPRPRKVRPLRERLEMIDRLPRFHFDDNLQSMSALGRREDEIRIEGRSARPDRDILLPGRIDADLVAPPKPGLQLTNDAIVFQLFADRPHQNRAQRSLQPC